MPTTNKPFYLLLSLILFFSCGEKTGQCISVTEMGDINIELYHEGGGTIAGGLGENSTDFLG